MVVKFFESTYDSFKDKIKNPFYGTLFTVWIIRNREFIYNVFFNDDCTSEQRLEILRIQFLNLDSLVNFIGTILISLGLMILIYISLNLSRFIVELSERILKPRIQKLFSESSIVSREDFIDLEKNRDYFQKRYSEERSERVKLQEELDNNQKKDLKLKSIDSAKDDKINTIINKWKRLKPEYLTDFKTLKKKTDSQSTSYQIEQSMKNIASIREFKDHGLISTFEKDNKLYSILTELGQELAYTLKSREE
jgi:hypothetical protein